MRLGCGIHDHIAGTVTLPIPTTPDPTPGYEPPTYTGSQGDRYEVAIGDFPANRIRGVLFDARIEELDIRSREAGGNQVSVSVPATKRNLRLIGDQVDYAFDRAGNRLYEGKNAAARELIVGSTSDGKARYRFVVRDPWESDGNRVTLKGVGFIGGLTSDRTIGAPTRLNRIGDAIGSFEYGDLRGWREVGDIDASVVSGGIDGGYKVRLRGVPNGDNYIEARVRYTQVPRNWGRQRVGGFGYVQLPGYGPDIEDYGLISVAVTDAVTGRELWPANNVDAEAVIVTGEMRRGTFTRDQQQAFGFLPTPPYNVDVWIRLYPVDETEYVYFDKTGIYLRENTSTENPWDKTRHIGRLFVHAQTGRDKSDWGIRTSEGAASGIVEIGTWWHEDGQSLNEAIEAVCADGVECWDYPSGRREVRTAVRRGAVRTDVRVNPWDVLGRAKFQVDPGAMATAVRATSSAGSNWGGADAGAINTSQSRGQVIDVTVSGPAGMTPGELQAWVERQLGTLRLIQATSTVFVPWRLGQRISVGDTLQIAQQAGSSVHSDWMRVHGWAPDLDGRRFVALSVGTDPTLGGG